MLMAELKNLEQQLIKAESVEHARSILKGFSKSQLVELALYLKAFPQKKTIEGYTVQIVRSTYECVRQSQIIRNIRLK